VFLDKFMVWCLIKQRHSTTFYCSFILLKDMTFYLRDG
jgi:hypothetical protein